MEIKSERLKFEVDRLPEVTEVSRVVLEDYIEGLNKIYEIADSKGLFRPAAYPRVAEQLSKFIHCMLSDGILTPLTGNDDEWQDSRIYCGDGLYENKKNHRVMKDVTNDKGAYYVDAIIWQPDNELQFHGTVEGIRSLQYVSFPFTPKTFYIDIIRDYHDLEWFIENDIKYHTDIGAESLFYRYIIKDKNKLEEVRKVYKKI